jgi:hypothetical protein
VHQTPQFHDIILQWSSSQQQSPFSIESQQCLPPLRLKILDILRFIQHHVVPLLPSKRKMVLYHKLIWCNAHMEWVIFTPPMPLHLPFFLWSKVCQYLECRTPLLKLHLPIYYDCGRHYYQMWTPNPSFTC